MYKFMAKRATDPRDRVYGILGLHTDSTTVEADYSKTLFEVFRDATIHIIIQTQKLSVLGQIFNQKSDLDMRDEWSTWVLKWKPAGTPVSLTLPGDDFSASGDLPFRAPYTSGQGKELNVTGIKIDRVCHFSTVSTAPENMVLRIIDAWDIANTGPGNGYPNEPFIKSFISTILCGYFSIEQNKSQWRDEVYLYFARDWAFALFTSNREPIVMKKYSQLSISALECFYDAQNSHVSMESVDKSRISDEVLTWIGGAVSRLHDDDQVDAEMSIMEDLLTNKDVPIPLDFFIALYGAIAPKRSFFVTERNLMGMGETSMQNGDVVVILPGHKAPLMFRPAFSTADITYLVIGHCYLHGRMYGEAVSNIREPIDLDSKTETFILR
jgi:hypothetical protein